MMNVLRSFSQHQLGKSAVVTSHSIKIVTGHVDYLVENSHESTNFH